MSAELRMFGPMSVVVGDRRLGPRDFGGRKAKQVLEILALENRLVSKDQLAASLWDDSAPRDAEGCLEHYVSLLRRQLRTGRGRGPAIVRTEPGGYRLDSEHVWIDVAAVDAIEATCGDSADRALVESALALMRGDLLEDEPFAEWALPARSRYRERKVRLACAAGDLALRERDFDAAVDWAQTAAATDALNEASHRCLMLAHYARGERGAALRTFAALQRALVDEMGVDAMRATTSLHKAILDEVPVDELLPMRAGSAVDIHPAPSHAPAIAGDVLELGELGHLGRQSQLSALLAACTNSQTGSGGPVMVLVEGGSGLGKSRFLREAAALLPECTVRTVRCTPGMQDVRGALMEEVVAALVDANANTATRATLFGSAVTEDAVSVTAVHELEQCLAETPRFVVMIDDAHWADVCSVRLLSYLTERGRQVGGAFVLALNDEDPRPDNARLSLRAAGKIRLGPLSETDLEPLGIDDVYAATGGLPVAVVEHARASAGLPAQMPDSYRQSVLRRVGALGENAWQVAVASAASGPPCAPSAVAALLGWNPLDVAEGQDRLCAIGLLRPAADGYAFRYPLQRAVLRETISPARLRLLDESSARPAESQRFVGGHAAPGPATPEWVRFSPLSHPLRVAGGTARS